jgi:hypothetical protein
LATHSWWRTGQALAAILAPRLSCGHHRTVIPYPCRRERLVGATLYDRLNYNFVRDIAPIATIIRQPLVMVVHPSFPGETVPEFIAHAKANPGKVNMASAGNGTGPHLVGELFKAIF